MNFIYLWIRAGYKYLYHGMNQLLIKRKQYKSINIPLREILRLQAAPYKLNTETILFGKKIKINSPFWYLFGLKEIYFEKHYFFESTNCVPYIIDCGSNIGLGIIFFKKMFPDAKIIGFEPDPAIYKLLEHNISVFGFENVEVYQKAVWVNNNAISFKSDGAVGGSIRLLEKTNEYSLDKIEAVRLRDLLANSVIDFLKIDIEGAEFDVIKDCRDVLKNANNIFIEYHSVVEKEQRIDELLNILKSTGFRVYIKEAWNILDHPFTNHPDLAFDLQLNIFAYKKQSF